MTLPNSSHDAGPVDVNTAQGLFLHSANGTGDASVANLPDRDQPTVTEVYKAKFVTGGHSAWTDVGSYLGQVSAALAAPGLSILNTLAMGLSGAGTDITTALTNIFHTWNNFWDGVFHTSGSTGKTSSDVLTAAAALSNKSDDIAKAIYNGWYGSGGTGTAVEVEATLHAIRMEILSMGGS